jgi:hypothetical protein
MGQPRRRLSLQVNSMCRSSLRSRTVTSLTPFAENQPARLSTSMRYLPMRSIVVAILLMLCVGAKAQTVTECGRSDGYSYYFAGGAVPTD